MKHQASKLFEMTGMQPNQCKHTGANMALASCLDCQHEAQLAAKDKEIERLDCVIADMLENMVDGSIKDLQDIVKSLESKVMALEKELDQCYSEEGQG